MFIWLNVRKIFPQTSPLFCSAVRALLIRRAKTFFEISTSFERIFIRRRSKEKRERRLKRTFSVAVNAHCGVEILVAVILHVVVDVQSKPFPLLLLLFVCVKLWS